MAVTRRVRVAYDLVMGDIPGTDFAGDGGEFIQFAEYLGEGNWTKDGSAPIYTEYRVTAQPYVNVREKPDANSKDIGDRLYGTILKISAFDSTQEWGKLYAEQGWVNMAFLKLRKK